MAEKTPRLWLVLELETPQKKAGGGLQVLTTAIVSFGRKAAKGEKVVFFRDGLPYGTIANTDENGRASQFIDIPVDAAAVSVEAEVVGISTARDRKILPITKEKPKRPEEAELELKKIELEQAKISKEIENLTKPAKIVARKVYVDFSGKNGEQKLFISVSDEDGMPIPDFPILIVDGDEGKIEKTDTDGHFIYQMNFTERDRYVEVRAGNEHSLIWRGRILGPAERR